jgi:gliding motility-associated-like protein
MKIKNTFFLLSLFFLLSIDIYSQTWNWAINAGGTTSDKGTAIVTDKNGFSYITGYFNEAADFGTLNMPLIDLNSKEVFIAKVDPMGNYVWVQRGSNHYDDRGLGICLDPSGNIYVTGTCWGGIIFGDLNVYCSSSFTDQIFLLKLDNDGNFIWLKNAGNEQGDDHGHDVVSDDLGNIYVTGFISNWSFGCGGPNVATFDALSVPLNNCDSLGFVAKISPAGDWQWVQTFGGVDGERDNRIAIDFSSNVYISGGFTGTKQFGTSTISSIGGVDIYVIKYDENGVFQYVKNTGSSLDDRANDITVNVNNDIYITGEFRDKVPFGTDTINNNGSANGRDIFVAKMDVLGNWKWASKAGSNAGDEKGCGIVGNDKHNIFVTGQYKDTAYFGNTLFLNPIAPDSIQIFVAAIDTLGKWKWVLQAGGQDDDDRGNGVACDTSCNVYVAGYYTLNSTFGNTTLTNYGNKDIFISKIDNACFDYPIEVIVDTTIIVENPSYQPDSLQEIFIYIPNAFSPNDDELNQTFKPIVNSTVPPENYILQIFNRQGELLFESLDFNIGWDGTYNNHNPYNEVYTWKMEFEILEEKYIKSGFVLIIK